MPSFEVLELSLFSYAFILKADFGWIFMRKIFPLFPFLCCFRFLCYGVPSLLLLFLFCSIGLANRKFSLVCVILLVRSIYYCYCIISDCLSFFCFLFNNKCYNKQIIISSSNIIVVCDKLEQQKIIVHLYIIKVEQEDYFKSVFFSKNKINVRFSSTKEKENRFFFHNIKKVQVDLNNPKYRYLSFLRLR